MVSEESDVRRFGLVWGSGIDDKLLGVRSNREKVLNVQLACSSLWSEELDC